MESSQLFGGTEECSSSESGWTMYIASPIHNDDGDDDHHDYEEEDDDGNDGNSSDDDNDSDDSMASDASTGPSHREHPFEHGEDGHGVGRLEHDQDEADDEYYPHKSSHRNMKKGGERRGTRKEKEDSVPANSATSHVQNGAKVRKTTWFKKGK
ncbi:PREDICTED: prostatic spermine-binding protein-like [Nelumbo nucifera]|uniref:Prostatic spermine-binding protein-like n=2 Tax=Nelumbo nucifera TaxID=4432 RepID=A0A1U8AGW2_NELNU|nr:PREDICTED: prostatic spermine-binding protein-like [Nelumbo nucifera]DAD35160.1 TPA_asm: hypothetical protein HUJ06_005800 [Nelumbo nucifera]